MSCPIHSHVKDPYLNKFTLLNFSLDCCFKAKGEVTIIISHNTRTTGYTSLYTTKLIRMFKVDIAHRIYSRGYHVLAPKDIISKEIPTMFTL